jgi:hypothetical protein
MLRDVFTPTTALDKLTGTTLNNSIKSGYGASFDGLFELQEPNELQ